MNYKQCEHPYVYFEDGEPSIGPYVVCENCGAVLNSEGIWKEGLDCLG